jgi:shikimate dehydrogenase
MIVYLDHGAGTVASVDNYRIVRPRCGGVRAKSIRKRCSLINGDTILIAHLGYPTHAFKAPLIYNPWFDKMGINAVVMPMGVEAKNYAAVLDAVFRLTNIRGALVTMPHKMATVALVDEVSTTARIAGACNAVLRRADGTLAGDMFDGDGFVRGVVRKGRTIAGARALVVGSGGVGSAIAASLAAAQVGGLGVFDANTATADALAARLCTHYPRLRVDTGSNDPAGYDIVVNATPLGMNDNDPLPMDVDRISPNAFVGEVVMKQQFTPFLRAAQAKGCTTQVGVDMLFEQIPAYLEFFGFPTTTPEELRSVARIVY